MPNDGRIMRTLGNQRQRMSPSGPLSTTAWAGQARIVAVNAAEPRSGGAEQCGSGESKT
jgi:hypothetical protein